MLLIIELKLIYDVVCVVFCELLIYLCSLIAYIRQNENEDPLVNPSEFNPFKDRSKCILL